MNIVPPNTKVSVKKGDGSKLKLSVSPETTLEEWIEHFETIMSYIGFVPSQIEEVSGAMKMAYIPELEDGTIIPMNGGVTIVEEGDEDEDDDNE